MEYKEMDVDYNPISPGTMGIAQKISSGIECEKLISEEKQIFLEFQTLNYLTQLKTKNLPKEDFEKAMILLDNELGKKRIRSRKFLEKKYKQGQDYFIGLYLGEELIGVVCGFPREDYLLMSEIVIDSKFQKRGFGKILVKKFEKVGFENHNKINIGALDNAIKFYESLGYSPFLLVQFNNKEYSKEDFEDFEILSIRDQGVELKIDSFSLNELKKLRKKFSKANLQYIFIKQS
jgi:GNAT superfamily N-acetyltransferase|tara:strand:+ start:189 stop:890 length:702 start_codon:yes stop_codon:yes gene_type:complete